MTATALNVRVSESFASTESFNTRNCAWPFLILGKKGTTGMAPTRKTLLAVVALAATLAVVTYKLRN